MAAITAEQAIAAVLASPDDLELRRVAGDRLAELGDPRGEFIALSFAGESAANAERMTTLFNKHASDFADALAPISTRAGMRFAHGFVAELSLDKATIGLTAEMWDAALVSPYWATVETLHIGDKVPEWWLRAFAAAPCSQRVRRIVLRPTPLRNRGPGEPSVVLERAAPGGPLRITVARAAHRKLGPLLAGLSPDQLDALAAGASGFVLADIAAARRAPPPRKRPPARGKPKPKPKARAR